MQKISNEDRQQISQNLQLIQKHIQESINYLNIESIQTTICLLNDVVFNINNTTEILEKYKHDE